MMDPRSEQENVKPDSNGLWPKEHDFVTAHCAKCPKTGCARSRGEISNCMDSYASHARSVAHDLLVDCAMERVKIMQEEAPKHADDPEPFRPGPYFKRTGSSLTDAELDSDEKMNRAIQQTWGI